MEEWSSQELSAMGYIVPSRSAVDDVVETIERLRCKEASRLARQCLEYVRELEEGYPEMVREVVEGMGGSWHHAEAQALVKNQIMHMKLMLKNELIGKTRVVNQRAEWRLEEYEKWLHRRECGMLGTLCGSLPRARRAGKEGALRIPGTGGI